MLKIRIKKENGELGISLILQFSKVKQSFQRKIRTLGIKIKAIQTILKVLRANPETISLAKNENKISLCFEEKEKRRKQNPYLVELPFGKIKSRKSRTAKATAALTIIALLLQTTMAGFLFPSASSVLANELCSVDVDVVLVIDVSGSMEDGAVPTQCDWWQLELVGPSYQCVSYNEEGLTEQGCSEKPSPPQCSSPSYTPATNKKIDDAKLAANSFLNNLESNDQSSLVSFSDTVALDKPLSNNHTDTKTAVNNLITGGATNIGDAIGEASNELSSERTNAQATKAIILLTDGKANKPNGPGYGEDPDDVLYAEQKAQQAGDLGHKIFTIGLGDNSEINETMLQNIADMTGAKYYNASNGSDLSEIYDEIAYEVCQYGSISGCKYQDSNADGNIEGENTLSDWEIILSEHASSTQLTDENGCYAFAGLLAGDYTVSEGQNIDKLPFLQTYPIPTTTPNYSITLAKGENVEDIDFANVTNDLCQAEEISRECISTTTAEVLYSYNYEFCGDDYTTTTPDETCMIEEPEDETSTSTPTTTPTTTIESSNIVINEIMQNPEAVSDSEGEWFELYNTTSSDIELSGCIIRDNGGDNHIINASLVVPTNGYAVLAKNGTSTENGGIIPDYVYSGMILSNSSDEIVLTCNEVEIDRVEYDNGLTFPDPNGASMILASPELDNNIGSNWCTSTSAFGDGDLGTPGSQNDSCGDESSTTTDETSTTTDETSTSTDETSTSTDETSTTTDETSTTTDETSTTTEETSTPSGSSGGGTILFPNLTMGNMEVQENNVVISWTTRSPGTSQVIYSAEGEPHTLDINDNTGSPPKYGYAHTTAEYDTDPKVTVHTVTIIGLDPNTTYYFRSVSRSSPPIFSKEFSFTTLTLEQEEQEPADAEATTSEEEVSLEQIEEELNEIEDQVEGIREEVEKKVGETFPVTPEVERQDIKIPEEVLEQVGIGAEEEPATTSTSSDEEKVSKPDKESASVASDTTTAGKNKPLAAIGQTFFNLTFFYIALMVAIVFLVVYNIFYRRKNKK